MLYLCKWKRESPDSSLLVNPLRQELLRREPQSHRHRQVRPALVPLVHPSQWQPGTDSTRDGPWRSRPRLQPLFVGHLLRGRYRHPGPQDRHSHSPAKGHALRAIKVAPPRLPQGPHHRPPRAPSRSQRVPRVHSQRGIRLSPARRRVILSSHSSFYQSFSHSSAPVPTRAEEFLFISVTKLSTFFIL